jgi:AcrR family transcriptional regulator
MRVREGSSGAIPRARRNGSREALVEAAERLFLERGFGSVSMDELAVAARFAGRLHETARRSAPQPRPVPMSDRTDPITAAKIDRITRDLLAQLELQTQVVLHLLEHAESAQREALLERLGELRGRLVRLRANVLGASKPQLVLARFGRTQLPAGVPAASGS